MRARMNEQREGPLSASGVANVTFKAASLFCPQRYRTSQARIYTYDLARIESSRRPPGFSATRTKDLTLVSRAKSHTTTLSKQRLRMMNHPQPRAKIARGTADACKHTWTASLSFLSSYKCFRSYPLPLRHQSMNPFCVSSVTPSAWVESQPGRVKTAFVEIDRSHRTEQRSIAHGRARAWER